MARSALVWITTYYADLVRELAPMAEVRFSVGRAHPRL
jgi:hypothetical protein